MQNKMWSITLDKKLHLAPIGANPQSVLDIATGTGIWAIDFGTHPPISPSSPNHHLLLSAAYTYPSARVIGTDLSVIQPAAYSSQSPPLPLVTNKLQYSLKPTIRNRRRRRRLDLPPKIRLHPRPHARHLFQRPLINIQESVRSTGTWGLVRDAGYVFADF